MTTGSGPQDKESDKLEHIGHKIHFKEQLVSEDIKPKVDINSPEFRAGVEAGLKSTAGTKDWQAGLELGQVLKAEDEKKAEVTNVRLNEPTLPLFLRDTSEGSEENLQDEKDETPE